MTATAKIKEYKLGNRGIRGAVVSVPAIFLQDNNLHPGDVIEIHRGKVNDKDALVIFPKQTEKQNQVNSN